jgi:hypothetical protein
MPFDIGVGRHVLADVLDLCFNVNAGQRYLGWVSCSIHARNRSSHMPPTRTRVSVSRPSSAKLAAVPAYRNKAEANSPVGKGKYVAHPEQGGMGPSVGADPGQTERLRFRQQIFSVELPRHRRRIGFRQADARRCIGVFAPIHGCLLTRGQTVRASGLMFPATSLERDWRNFERPSTAFLAS